MPCLPTRPRREGVITPLTAIFSVFLLGMVALAVDTSWIVLTQSELQNAADAAAMAAAQQLYNSYTQYNLPGQSAATKTALLNTTVAGARTQAKTYAAYNGAGGVSSLTLQDSDITVGFTDSKGTFTTYSTGGNYPNTVSVVMRRDKSANNPLSLFFAPVLGTKTIALTASATSTLYTGVVDSFKAATISMMPMAYDYNAWKNFVATGKDPDGNITLDSSGNPEILVYPSTSAAGNFGLLSLDDSHGGASTVSTWMSGGASSYDVQTLLNNGLIPLSKHSASSWDWQGETGFQASNVMTANAQTGKVFWLPLFTPYNANASSYAAGTGQGSNYNYNIVAFVPVKLMPVSSTNRQIVVEPVAYADPNAIYATGTVVPAGTSASSVATIMPPKLSR